MSIPLGAKSCRWAFKAAGFIATNTSGLSPGVNISKSAIWTWKDETPAIVPWGALISAGKDGSVARSFPKIADVSVNLVPTSCIPSPESPANLIVIAGIDSTVLFSSLIFLSSPIVIFAGIK